MKHMIRKVSPISVFRITFFLYWVIGIVMAILYGIFFGIMAMIPGVFDDPEMGGMGQLIGGIGAFALIVGGFFMSILYGAFGATISLLLTLAYNVLARTIGGFELELEETEGASVISSDFGLRPGTEPRPLYEPPSSAPPSSETPSSTPPSIPLPPGSERPPYAPPWDEPTSETPPRLPREDGPRMA